MIGTGDRHQRSRPCKQRAALSSNGFSPCETVACALFVSLDPWRKSQSWVICMIFMLNYLDRSLAWSLTPQYGGVFLRFISYNFSTYAACNAVTTIRWIMVNAVSKTVKKKLILSCTCQAPRMRHGLSSESTAIAREAFQSFLKVAR